MERRRWINVRLSDEEIRMIDELAKILGTPSRAEICRFAIKRLYEELVLRAKAAEVVHT